MKRLITVLRIAVIVLSLALSVAAQSTMEAPVPGTNPAQPSTTAPQEIKFISVFVDKETAEADDRLARFLENTTARYRNAEGRVRFDRQKLPYGSVIRRFAEWDRTREKGSYIARVTPYAYVVAQMLGAQFDILAIYESKATKGTTYQSYFVVNAAKIDAALKRGPIQAGPPTLDQLAGYLKTSFTGTPAKFIFHDRFSTSSYFLPSLFFRERRIFAMRQATTEGLTAITVEKFPVASSSALVKEVGQGRADLAAVWDGTKQKFPGGAVSENRAENVYFIPIPTLLPNDLLVCSTWLDPRLKGAIREALQNDKSAGRNKNDDPKQPRDPAKEDPDDFWSWINETDLPDATLGALAQLRQDARERPAPVTVKIDVDGRNLDPAKQAEYLDAAKQAVRLSGTEFVVYDENLHRHADVTWSLASTHDRALMLTSQIAGFALEKQEFPISFVDANDLPKRIADLVHSRMRRIRYVWRYEEKYPAILRDLDFKVDRDDLMVQRITWDDPDKHDFEEDTPFKSTIVNNVDFNKLQLSDSPQFPRDADGSFSFEPMSNVAYRVVLVREPEASLVWVSLPYIFVGLFVLAAGGLVVDLRRRQPPPKGFIATYQAIVDQYHHPWRDVDVEEGDVLWCDSVGLDQFVKELKLEGRFMNLVRNGSFDFSVGPIAIKFSLFLKVFESLFRSRRKLPTELLEVSGAGQIAALDNLLHFLVVKRRLAPFIGFPEQPEWEPGRLEKPSEWQALNEIVSRHLQRLGIGPKQRDANLRRDNEALASVVSSHFHGVIKEGMHDASFFRQTWQVQKNSETSKLVHAEDLGIPLPRTTQDGPVTSVVIEINLPIASVFPPHVEIMVDAWVLGKLVGKAGSAEGTLSLQLKPIALLRTPSHA